MYSIFFYWMIKWANGNWLIVNGLIKSRTFNETFLPTLNYPQKKSLIIKAIFAEY